MSGPYKLDHDINPDIPPPMSFGWRILTAGAVFVILFCLFL